MRSGVAGPGPHSTFQMNAFVRSLLRRNCVKEWVLSNAAVGPCDSGQRGVGCCSTGSRNQSILHPQKSLLEEPPGKIRGNNRAATGDSEAQHD